MLTVCDKNGTFQCFATKGRLQKNPEMNCYELLYFCVGASLNIGHPKYFWASQSKYRTSKKFIWHPKVNKGHPKYL